MFKLVKILLAAAHLFAQREEQKQREKQKQFKKKQAALAETLGAEALRARAKADVLASQAAGARAESTIGSNDINEAERVAASLRSSLSFIVAKR